MGENKQREREKEEKRKEEEKGGESKRARIHKNSIDQINVYSEKWCARISRGFFYQVLSWPCVVPEHRSLHQRLRQQPAWASPVHSKPAQRRPGSEWVERPEMGRSKGDGSNEVKRSRWSNH